MRRFVFGIISFSLLTGCSEKESTSVDKEIQGLSDPSQFFEIANDKGDTIEARNGTRLIIPAKAFVLSDDQEPKAKIQIEVKEIFRKSEMIVHNLRTVSDGRLIESYGMTYLKASSDGQELKIRDDKFIELIIPNKRRGAGGELFYGHENDSTINWEYASLNTDTVETITSLSDGDTVLETLYDDSTAGQPVSGKGDIMEAGYETVIGSAIPEYYYFKIENLGWINCDRFIDMEDKTELELGLKNYNNPVGFLVFSELNSVMRVFFEQDGKAKIKALPNGYSVDIVIMDKINDDLMWTKQSIRLGTDTNVILETKTIDKDQLKEELSKLDK